MSELRDNLWLGVIEDNNDPKRKGRVKVRIDYMHGDIPTEDLPWSQPLQGLSGYEFSVPPLNKVVMVSFPTNNMHFSLYLACAHYNINLQNKLDTIPEEDYARFHTLYFSDRTQIYISKAEGLVLDHVYSNICIDNQGDISLSLRDNGSFVKLGSPDATQQVVLGTTYFQWMDKFMDVWMNAFIGNAGAPVIPTPELLQLQQEYNMMRDQFVSDHVWVVDNNEVLEQLRDAVGQDADKWTSTSKNNDVVTEGPFYVPEPRPETGRAEQLDDDVPYNIQQSTSLEQTPTIAKPPIIGDHENGKIPTSKMKRNKHLAKTLGGDSSFLIAEASDMLDQMMAAYNAANFKGKQPVKFTDGYRNYDRQLALWNKWGSGQAARPGTSNHGWGIAIDMWWGVMTKMKNDISARPTAFKHPVYRWFFENGWKYGWHNPAVLRDNNKLDEWWHWEYTPSRVKPNIISSSYQGEFDFVKDVAIIKNHRGLFT
jgi:LAS superfamily LD-carboxypeptidase LdcB